MYRRTKKTSESRKRQIEAMRRGKDRARMEREAPDYPQPLPELRMRITVERFDFGREAHTFELLRSRRVDQFRVLVDGKPWTVAGLARVLEGIRKATPRVLSDRACY